MNVTKLKVWLWFSLMIGSAIGITIVYMVEGLPFIPVLLGYIIYGGLLAIVLYFIGRSKVPDYDERTSRNMRNFFAYTSTILLGAIGIIVLIAYLTGIEQLEVGFLAVILMMAYAVIGIGSFIAQKV